MGKKRKKKWKWQQLFIRQGKLRWGPTLITLGLLLWAVSRLSGTPLLPPATQPASPVNQEQVQRDTFISTLAPHAQHNQRTYGVLASITLAQAILESNWGESQLASQYHNYYGIKSHDPNNSIVLKTQEFYNGEWVTINGRFAVYEDVGASMRAHSLLLVNGTSWNPNQYARVLAATNYQQAAQALVQDGYATDPDYAKKIIRVVETYQLQRFDE